MIREQITPKGDGNIISFLSIVFHLLIREQITPKGDGNVVLYSYLSLYIVY